MTTPATTTNASPDAAPAWPQEWTRTTAAAYVAQLPPAVREYLADAIRDHDAAGHMGQAVEAIREALAEFITDEQGKADAINGRRDILGVVFTPSWYDNGYFFNGDGHVIYADDSRAELHVDGVDEAFTELYGVVSPNAGFAYSTHTGETEYVEQAVEWELSPWLHGEAKRAAGGAAYYAPVRLSPRGAVHTGSLARRNPARYNPMCPAGSRGSAQPVAEATNGPVTCTHCRNSYPQETAKADDGRASA